MKEKKTKGKIPNNPQTGQSDASLFSAMLVFHFKAQEKTNRNIKTKTDA